MTAIETIAQRLQALPPEKQQAVLDYIDFLSERYADAPPPTRQLLHTTEGVRLVGGPPVTDEDVRRLLEDDDLPPLR